MPSGITATSETNLPDGSQSQRHSETRVATVFARDDVIKKMITEAKKTPGDPPQRLKVESKPMVHAGFDYLFGGELSTLLHIVMNDY